MVIRPIDFSKTFLAGKKLQINTLIKALRYSSLRFISLGTGKALGNCNNTLKTTSISTLLVQQETLHAYGGV